MIARVDRDTWDHGTPGYCSRLVLGTLRWSGPGPGFERADPPVPLRTPDRATADHESWDLTGDDMRRLAVRADLRAERRPAGDPIAAQFRAMARALREAAAARHVS